MRRLQLITALALFAGLALSACRQPPEVGGARPWARVDLTATAPSVEAPATEAATGQPPFESVVSYLGSREVRDLTRVPPDTLAIYPHQSAGQVRALAQRPGSRLAWHLELGADPYLTFAPLTDEERGCACTFRAGLRQAGGEIVELFRLAPAGQSPGPSVPAAVAPLGATAAEEIDLGRWAGQEIDLLLQIDGPAGGAKQGARMLWAGASVVHRPAAGPPASRGRGRTDRTMPPNLLLIGVDTLRADHVGAWRERDAPGWIGPSLTPALDRLADASDVWLDAYSTFNVTNPSFASILTGLYGKNHGVYDLQTPLPPAHTTLAELLREAGYDTLAVIAASHLGDHNSGLGQGFDTVVTASEHASAEMAVAQVMDWIAERGASSGRPYFVWLHLFDPHTPHVPPQPYASGLRPAGAFGLAPVAAWTPFRRVGPVVYEQPVLGGHRFLYAGEVAYLDRQLDRLLGFIDSRGARSDTLVALTSDHGENLGEHGILHRHIGLWETTTHVPLMIRWPVDDGGESAASAGRRLRGLVQTIDLFPTLLAAAGIDVPAQDGEELRALTAEGRRGRRAVFAEHASLLGLTVRTPTHRLMRSAGNPQVEDGNYLFDLTTDPGETRNLAGLDPELEESLANLLTRWLEERRPLAEEAKPRTLSQEEIDRLRSLGYL